MKKTMLKEKILVIASCLAIIVSVVVSVLGVQEMVTPDPIIYEDGAGINGNVDIGEDDVPLGQSKDNVKTTTKTSTKKNKLTKAAEKTSTRTKTSTEKKATRKNTGTSQIRTETTVKTVVQTKRKKGSKTETVITTVTTTVKTTTTQLESGVMDISKIATADTAKEVVELFKKMSYQVVINPTANYTGYFNSRTRSITLKSNDGTTIYHELGHFLGYRAGNVDRTSSFKAIYDEEKSLYTAVNKTYVLQTPSEYFAESYRNYVEDAATLQKERPKTYAAIVSALKRVIQ